jgi:archaellum component FlaC
MAERITRTCDDIKIFELKANIKDLMDKYKNLSSKYHDMRDENIALESAISQLTEENKRLKAANERLKIEPITIYSNSRF